MRISSFRIMLTIAAVLIPGMSLSSVQAFQPRANPSAASPVVTKVVSRLEQKAAMAYWTRDRVAAAKPLAMPVQSGAAKIDGPSLARPDAGGAPGMARAGMPAANADRLARAAYPQDWKANEAEVQNPSGDTPEVDAPQADGAMGTSQIYTSYIANKNVVQQTLYPHRWIGRVSFTTPTGTSYCSGTSISGNVMLTAAHCLYDSTNNQWYSNWALSPAYRLGNAPYGTFVATQCWVLTTWVNLSGSFNINSWTPHDVGVCKMGNNSSGTTLNNAVGWMGRQWNYPYVRHQHTMGYPFRDTNDAFLTDSGAYLRTCVAETFQQTTDVRGMGCNFGRGISGGPVIANYAPSTLAGNADGVNSGLFIGTQNLYAARFTDNNIVPLCNAAVC